MSHLAQTVEVGGNKGKIFIFDGSKSGITLKKISVWFNDKNVIGIAAWLADGQCKDVGKCVANSKHETFAFDIGEYITSLSLWPDKKRKHLGAIQFNTNFSKKFHAGIKTEELTTGRIVDIASGICVGIKGKANNCLFRFGFIFINNIKFAELTNVEYLNLDEKGLKINPTKIKSMSYQNSTSETQEYTIETSKKFNEISNWLISKPRHMFNLNVIATIPKIAEIKGGYEFNPENKGKHESETTDERTESFSFPLRVPPHKTVDVSIEIGEAEVNLLFTAIAKITCVNDSMVELKTSGTYKGVTYSDVKVIVNESEKNLVWTKNL